MRQLLDEVLALARYLAYQLVGLSFDIGSILCGVDSSDSKGLPLEGLQVDFEIETALALVFE